MSRLSIRVAWSNTESFPGVPESSWSLCTHGLGERKWKRGASGCRQLLIIQFPHSSSMSLLSSSPHSCPNSWSTPAHPNLLGLTSQQSGLWCLLGWKGGACGGTGSTVTSRAKTAVAPEQEEPGVGHGAGHLGGHLREGHSGRVGTSVPPLLVGHLGWGVGSSVNLNDNNGTL